ncbi:MAG: hypothetical protein QOF65_3072 [Thermoleophilaceae bacterium]|nr:hypothetical protein [Thermoleophilaceae bacterium]
METIGGLDRRLRLHPLPINEYVHVPADLTLFVQDPADELGMGGFKLADGRTYGRTFHLDIRSAARPILQGRS